MKSLRKTYTPRAPINVGDKYNRLTVVKFLGYNTRSKKVYQFLCECGKVYDGIGSRVKNGKTKSCGCYRQEIRKSKKTKEILKKATNLIKKPDGEASFNYVFAIYKDRAKNSNIEFLLTKDHFRNLTKMNCHYCGEPPSNIGGSKANNGYYVYSGLDRIDNNLGYTLSNCVSCCKRCNIAKNNMTLHEFLDHVKLIYERHLK